MDTKNKTVAVACLGDSITKGYPFSAKDSWVGILDARSSHCSFINRGVCGQMSSEISRRFDKDVLDLHPDFAFLLCGTNDFLFSSASPEDVLEELSTMAGRAQQAGIAPVLLTPLLTIPEIAACRWDDGIDYDRVNRSLIQLHHLLSGFSQACGIPLIDLQSAYQTECKAFTPSACYADGLHPSLQGYAILAEIIEKSCRNLFSF